MAAKDRLSGQTQTSEYSDALPHPDDRNAYMYVYMSVTHDGAGTRRRKVWHLSPSATGQRASALTCSALHPGAHVPPCPQPAASDAS
jgi:hypothetical protein